MKKDLKAKLEEIDLLIKGASWEKAEAALSKLKRNPIPREDVVYFSSLCRRANLSSLGVTSLRPLVRPSSRKLVEEALPEEIIEYSLCLTKLGAIREAKNLLTNVKTENYPQAIRASAALNVKNWDYPEAIPDFRKYLEIGILSPYQRQIERLNLCMCLIFVDQLEEAEGILSEVLKSKEFDANPLIRANALRLEGNIHYQRHNYGIALEFFEKSFKAIPDKGGMDRFLARKWIAITNYISNNGDADSKKQIESIRKEANERKHWESLRDIDYQLACHHRDEKMLIHLYFGTPYSAFRERIKKRFSSLRIPETYQWNLLEGKKEKVVQVDWANSELKPGQSNHRLVSALSTDFYRPFATLDLFEVIYPDEYYSFGDSEQRVYQVVTRTRKWLSDKNYPLSIETGDNFTRFYGVNPCGILVKIDTGVIDRQTHQLKEIREKLGNQFTARRAAEVLGTSKRSILVLLAKGVESGLLSRSGSGTKVLYTFLSDSEKLAA